MLFGEGFSCRILYYFVGYLYVSGSGSITSVREERANLSAKILLVIMWFLFGVVSSSSGCLGWAALFHCGTPCSFHMIILGHFLSSFQSYEPWHRALCLTC